MTWTGPEVASIAGVDYRTFYNWTKQGILTPSVRAVEGSGHSAVYSNDDLITACLVAAARPLLTLDGLRVLVGNR